MHVYSASAWRPIRMVEYVTALEYVQEMAAASGPLSPYLLGHGYSREELEDAASCVEPDTAEAVAANMLLESVK